MKLSMRVRKARHQAGLSQQVLAVLYAYGAFLAVLAVAIPLRMRLMPRWQRS